MLRTLLQHVAYGEQKEAEKILKDHPELLLIKGEVTDYSGRTFKNISALQYAAWALDIHMLKMMLPYIRKDHAHRQLYELAFRGIKYFTIFAGTEIESKPESHFNYESYLSVLEGYIAHFSDRNKGENMAYWQIVDRAQRKLPAHIVPKYAREDRSLYPLNAHTLDWSLPTDLRQIRGDYSTIKALSEVRTKELAVLREEISRLKVSPNPRTQDGLDHKHIPENHDSVRADSQINLLKYYSLLSKLPNHSEEKRTSSESSHDNTSGLRK